MAKEISNSLHHRHSETKLSTSKKGRAVLACCVLPGSVKWAYADITKLLRRKLLARHKSCYGTGQHCSSGPATLCWACQTDPTWGTPQMRELWCRRSTTEKGGEGRGGGGGEAQPRSSEKTEADFAHRIREISLFRLPELSFIFRSLRFWGEEVSRNDEAMNSREL